MRWKTAAWITAIVMMTAAVWWIFLPWYRKRQVSMAVDDGNIKAFLKMIRYAEGTDGPEGYHVTYGYEHYIRSFADHPAVTGEWTGKRLPDAICIGARQQPGCKSTAAGAYQFTRPTWVEVKNRLSLPDFTPISQDMAAIEKIRERGALDLVKQGKFDEAVQQVNKEWASLPGSPYGQPVKTLAQVKQVYLNNGGNIA